MARNGRISGSNGRCQIAESFIYIRDDSEAFRAAVIPPVDALIADQAQADAFPLALVDLTSLGLERDSKIHAFIS